MTPERWQRSRNLSRRASRAGERAAFLDAMLAVTTSATPRGRSRCWRAVDDGFLDGRSRHVSAAESPASRIAVLTGDARPLQFSRCSAPAAWARSTARATRSSDATSRSRSCRARSARDPDRLARFEREARVLASLNHPHIGAIYGIEEATARVLVLELVEGETLYGSCPAAGVQSLGSLRPRVDQGTQAGWPTPSRSRSRRAESLRSCGPRRSLSKLFRWRDSAASGTLTGPDQVSDGVVECLISVSQSPSARAKAAAGQHALADAPTSPRVDIEHA